MYRQNAINALCESFLSPASVAMIVAGVEGDRERTCRRAFSWLQLAVNARVERRTLEGEMTPLSKEVDAALLPITFPGLVHLDPSADGSSSTPLPEMATVGGDRRFPRIRSIHAEVLAKAKDRYGDAMRAVLIDEEERALAKFQTELETVGLFSETAKRFERAFAREVAR